MRIEVTGKDELFKLAVAECAVYEESGGTSQLVSEALPLSLSRSVSDFLSPPPPLLIATLCTSCIGGLCNYVGTCIHVQHVCRHVVQ